MSTERWSTVLMSTSPQSAILMSTLARSTVLMSRVVRALRYTRARIGFFVFQNTMVMLLEIHLLARGGQVSTHAPAGASGPWWR